MKNHSNGQDGVVQQYESYALQPEDVVDVQMGNEPEQDRTDHAKTPCVGELSQSPTVNAAVQGTRKKGKTSWVWQHLTVQGNGRCSCNICNEILSTRSTTTLQYHLTHVHKMAKPQMIPTTPILQSEPSSQKKTRGRTSQQAQMNDSTPNAAGGFPAELSELWQLTSPVKMENHSAVQEEVVQQYAPFTLQLEEVVEKNRMMEMSVENESEQDGAGPAKRLRVRKLSQSPTVNQPVKVRKKAITSWVWQHLTVQGNGRCSCNICNEILGTKSTTTLQYHLTHVHKMSKPQTSPNLPSLRPSSLPPHQPTAQSDLEKCATRPKMSDLQPNDLSETIAHWIAADMLPPHVVDGRGFKKLMSYVAPGYQIPQLTTFTHTHIPAVMKAVSDNVDHDLRSALHVCYTTDVWTDNFLHHFYMTITVHFISPDWEMRSYVLTTVTLQGSINNSQIQEVIKTTRNDWHLNQVTHTVVADRGSNMNAGRIAGWHHMHCFGHKLNLCLTKYGVDAVPEWHSLLEKCKNIVTFCRYKGPDVVAKQQELQSFMETVVESEDAYSNIIFQATSIQRAHKTRWNSLCIMIESVVENHAAIHSLLMQYEEMELTLRSGEIRGLVKLIEFWAPFKRQSEAMKADRWPMLSRVWPAVSSLINFCEFPTNWGGDGTLAADAEEFAACGVDYKAAIERLKAAVLAALKIKFPKDETLILASSLDLRFKNLTDAYKVVEQYEHGMKHFLAVINDDFANYTSPREDQHAPDATEFDEMYGAVMDHQEDSANESNLVSELRTYLALPRLSKIEIDQFDLLTWWRDHEKTFPLLSRLAKKIHSIVATSASSERIFAKVGNVVSEKRSRLSPSNVNTSVFLHANMYNDEESAIPEYLDSSKI